MTSTPLNTMGYALAKAAYLQVAVVALSLLCLGLGGTVVWLARAAQQRPIHFIPCGGPGVSLPGVVPDTVASDYATTWLQSRYTFTPDSLKRAHGFILSTLHPTFRKSFEGQMEQETTMVREAKLSSQLTVLDATVQPRSGGTPHRLRVTMDARRTLWIGSQEAFVEAVQVTLTLQPWVSQGTPLGLVVVQVDDPQPLSLRKTR